MGGGDEALCKPRIRSLGSGIVIVSNNGRLFEPTPIGREKGSAELIDTLPTVAVDCLRLGRDDRPTALRGLRLVTPRLDHSYCRWGVLTMSIPGFSAGSSLYQSNQCYRSVAAINSTEVARVIPQVPVGGDLGWDWPSRCQLKCALAAVACNLACAAAGPAYVSCLFACGAAELACLSECNSYSSSGLFIA